MHVVKHFSVCCFLFCAKMTTCLIFQAQWARKPHRLFSALYSFPLSVPELKQSLVLAFYSDFAMSFIGPFSCCGFYLKAPTPAVHYYPHCGYVLSKMVTGLSWLAFILDTPWYYTHCVAFQRIVKFLYLRWLASGVQIHPQYFPLFMLTIIQMKKLLYDIIYFVFLTVRALIVFHVGHFSERWLRNA